MSLQLSALLLAHVCMACAAVDYADHKPFGWPELLGASYALAIGATL